MVGTPPGVEACAAPPLDVDASDPLVFGLFLGGSALVGGSLSPPNLFLLFLAIFFSQTNQIPINKSQRIQK